MVKKLRPLKLKGWTLTLNDTVISLKQVEKPLIVPKYELFIKEVLNVFNARLRGKNNFNWLIFNLQAHRKDFNLVRYEISEVL